MVMCPGESHREESIIVVQSQEASLGTRDCLLTPRENEWEDF